MSKKQQQAAMVYALTHVADWLINKDGKQHNLAWWQVELLKIGATVLITAAI